MDDKAEIKYFFTRCEGIFDSMRLLGQFAKLIVADNLEVLGLPKQPDIGLEPYLDALGRKPLSKHAAFLRLCKFFEVDP